MRGFVPRLAGAFGVAVTVALLISLAPGQVTRPKKLSVDVPHVSKDRGVTIDYPIAYVRVPRDEKNGNKFAEASFPLLMNPRSDLMLLHPDGKEDVLVDAGEGAVADPFVSFDGQWIYYAYFPSTKTAGGFHPVKGSDLYKVHVKSKKVVRLTRQESTPNTGVFQGKGDFPVYNVGPCPAPGGKVVFTSSRNQFVAPRSYVRVPALQLFVMDEDGSNVEQIGHLNVAGALHPVPLKDGRIMFSSLESQGRRGITLWGLWSIHPDGTNWGPLLSAFNFGSAPQITHFQTQLSNGNVVIEEYYNQNNWGFGSYWMFPTDVPKDAPAFGPGDELDPRNGKLRMGYPGGKQLPFSPRGIEALTPFTHPLDTVAPHSDPNDAKSPRVGKFTHPSAAPDNHLLTVWSPGPVNGNGIHLPLPDAGIYLIKSGKPVEEPGEMVLIKNDPKYHETWPRTVVPYERIYKVKEPPVLPAVKNDGKLHGALPEGTPFGLVGTSSFYKRESFPMGVVPKGKVTAGYVGSIRGANASGNNHYDVALGLYQGLNGPVNWAYTGSDAGKYDNGDIHAVRILVMEPNTSDGRPLRFGNAANERLRILGEIPVRKFSPSPPKVGAPAGATSAETRRGGRGVRGKDEQPVDPDGNPDTSFLAKIPADVAWTFQTLDKDGMVLNMAQTWHQLRPGEVRNDCGGCHAHSQQPTDFAKTAAAKKGYEVFDTSKGTPLLTDKKGDESGRQWDAKDRTGLRYVKGVKDVEYYRDVKPILERSCVACHTAKWEKPAGNLVLEDEPAVGGMAGAYVRLAFDMRARFGHKPVNRIWWTGGEYTSRYVFAPFQARRSLLVWKIHGRRTDGWTNDDNPTETTPGDASTLMWKGKKVSGQQMIDLADLDYTGSQMPPAAAVEGTYTGPKGEKVKVAALSDEDRRTIVRWIDLGCPIDNRTHAEHKKGGGHTWLEDNMRPTVTVTSPRAGANAELSRVLVGMHDYYTGLDMKSFAVTADFEVDGVKPGSDLAGKFKEASPGVWQMKLDMPITTLGKGKLTVSVKDRQGNVSRVERAFSVHAAKAKH